jgi:hypothetical protein
MQSWLNPFVAGSVLEHNFFGNLTSEHRAFFLIV